MPLTSVYIGEDVPTEFTKSICLLGPTVEDTSHSWRKEALRLLEEKGYEGVVFVPEFRDPQASLSVKEYAAIVAWEQLARHISDVLLVWLPRDRNEALGLTTNYVVGEDIDSGKMVFGAPPHTWKTQYLFLNAQRLKVPTATTLPDTVDKALSLLGEGAWRRHGEREVPLFIWRTAHFQQWYRKLCQAGNVLEHARVVWTHRSGPDRKRVFFWAIHAAVYITAERRTKVNEIVISRPDIATILLYHRGLTLDETAIILVKEFRTPVANESGYVCELPGGSSFKPVNDPRELAAQECLEETGLTVHPNRFTAHGSRQLLATISAHQGHLFSAEISDDELAWLNKQGDTPHGVEEDTERTYVLVKTVREIREECLVDWSMLGMILSVLTSSR